MLSCIRNWVTPTFLVLCFLSSCGFQPQQRKHFLELQQSDASTLQENPGCRLVADVTELDFGQHFVGCRESSKVLRLRLEGTCSSPVRIRKVVVGVVENSVFTLRTGPVLPVMLEKQKTLEFKIGGKAPNSGSYSSVLTVFSKGTTETELQVPLHITGKVKLWREETYRRGLRAKEDTLFVIDNSPRMYPYQDSLRTNLRQFINWAIRLDKSYHIGVITTDTLAKSAGCIQNKWIKNQTFNPVATFQRVSNVGVHGSYSTRPLWAAKLALMKDCNKGFFRENASLRLIFIGASPDYSPGSVTEYLRFFKSIKGYRNLDRIRASVVVGPPMKVSYWVRNHAIAAPRLWEVARSLKGAKVSIASSNWAATLSAIGSIGWGVPRSYFLSHTPDPKTIVVRVNGIQVNRDPVNGWSYFNSSNYVYLARAQTPPYNGLISIRYRELACPPNLGDR